MISVKFNTYVKNVGVVNNNLERLIFNSILGSFGALALLYILFLGNMVVNIVERRSLEADIRTFSSEVGNLELTYLSMSNTIDLALSQSMGFTETKANFTTRKSLGYLPTNTYNTNSADSVEIIPNDL